MMHIEIYGITDSLHVSPLSFSDWLDRETKKKKTDKRREHTILLLGVSFGMRWEDKVRNE